MPDYNFVKDIIIPILTCVIGALASHIATARQYKKKVQISLAPDKHTFKIYNTGNAGVVIKEIGIAQRKNILFAMPVDKTLTTDTDPMKISYSEDNFWLSVESAIGGKKIKGKFYCFVVSASKKRYKTVASMGFPDLWNYHEYYWGRNPNENEDSEVPF